MGGIGALHAELLKGGAKQLKHKEKGSIESQRGGEATTVKLKEGKRKVPKKRRSHLPQASVRKLGILGGIKQGLKLKKAKSRKHVVRKSTRGGFIFRNVLAHIRQLVVG